MPRVPTYNRTTQANQSQSGAQLTRTGGIRVRGARVQPTGTTGGTILGGLTNIAAAMTRKQERQDKLAAQETLVAARAKILGITDGKEGWNSKQNKDALDSFDGTVESLYAVEDDILGDANERVREMASPAIQEAIFNAERSITERRAKVEQQYQKQLYEAQIQLLTKNTIDNIDNKETRKNNLTEMNKVIDQEAVLFGVDPSDPGIQAAKIARQSNVVLGAVSRKLSTGNALAAEKLMQTMEGEGYAVDPKAKTEMFKSIQAGKKIEYKKNAIAGARQQHPDNLTKQIEALSNFPGMEPGSPLAMEARDYLRKKFVDDVEVGFAEDFESLRKGEKFDASEFKNYHRLTATQHALIRAEQEKQLTGVSPTNKYANEGFYNLLNAETGEASAR